ncbi:MAG: class I SAM-dependent methyltransferase [Flavobacterium sp.]
MDKAENYLEINKEAWNKRTGYHVNSDFYNNVAFKDGRNSLNDIEMKLLGDVTGKSILHLQCHFGQDTLSLARIGAVATGADLSDTAINEANNLSAETGVPARFICSDVYKLPEVLDEKFDIVFTTYGTIGWLPDLEEWAAVIAKFLKPGGRFVFAEFHPVVWMFDNNFGKVAYNYFKDDAIIERNSGTYAENGAPIEYETVSWNHSISEVVGSLINAGLTIESLDEYDYSPYNCFNDMDEYQLGRFRTRAHGNKLPMVYSISAHL